MRTFLTEFQNCSIKFFEDIAKRNIFVIELFRWKSIFFEIWPFQISKRRGGCEKAASLRFSANIDFRFFCRYKTELSKLWKTKFWNSLRQTFLLFGSKKNNQYWLSYGRFSAKIENRFGAHPENPEIACFWAKIDFQSYWALQKRYEQKLNDKVVGNTKEIICFLGEHRSKMNIDGVMAVLLPKSHAVGGV